jgi:hypothetical protein
MMLTDWLQLVEKRMVDVHMTRGAGAQAAAQGQHFSHPTLANRLHEAGANSVRYGLLLSISQRYDDMGH